MSGCEDELEESADDGFYRVSRGHDGMWFIDGADCGFDESRARYKMMFAECEALAERLNLAYKLGHESAKEERRSETTGT